MTQHDKGGKNARDVSKASLTHGEGDSGSQCCHTWAQKPQQGQGEWQQDGDLHHSRNNGVWPRLH